jgi:hypothetical protein
LLWPKLSTSFLFPLFGITNYKPWSMISTLGCIPYLSWRFSGGHASFPNDYFCSSASISICLRYGNTSI